MPVFRLDFLDSIDAVDDYFCVGPELGVNKRQPRFDLCKLDVTAADHFAFRSGKIKRDGSCRVQHSVLRFESWHKGSRFLFLDDIVLNVIDASKLGNDTTKGLLETLWVRHVQFHLNG